MKIGSSESVGSRYAVRSFAMGVVLLAWIAGAGTVASASLDGAVPLGEDLEISTVSAYPGESVSITGICFFEDYFPGDRYYLSLRSVEDTELEPFRATEATGAGGEVDLTFTLPVDQPVGAHKISSFCLADDQAFGGGDIDFTVLGQAEPTASPSIEPAPTSPVEPTPSPYATATVEVNGSTSGESELAETGAPTALVLVWGGLAVVLGAVVVVTQRRRV